jgi:transketolase
LDIEQLRMRRLRESARGSSRWSPADLSFEVAAPFGWERYVGPEGAIVGVNGFGASAPGPVVMREFGFTPEHVVGTAKALLKDSGS